MMVIFNSPIVKIINPSLILCMGLLYILGAGVAKYFGSVISWQNLFIGYLWVIFLQEGLAFLGEYTKEFDENLTLGNRKLKIPYRARTLLISFSFLTIVATLTVITIGINRNPTVFLLMFLYIIGGFGYSLPLFRIQKSGYGELVILILVAFFTPIFGFIFQSSYSLQPIFLVSFPITTLFLAMLLVYNLSSYASDLRKSQNTFMIRIGWQNGVLLHNILILCTYFLLLFAVTSGLPWGIFAPVFLTLPLGMLQIWLVQKIVSGGMPQWVILRILSSALFIISVYLLAVNFWTLS